MISIIIPAHNEAKVIRRCLDAICAGSDTNELEVIVACNGCNDETVVIVKEYGSPVRVVVTESAGKWRGLNDGDKAACGNLRFYIDADIIVDFTCIRKVADLLESGVAMAAAPKMFVDVSASSWWVRAFYNIWLDLPYTTTGMIGSGFYALSAEGRARFGQFPPITADDAFVRLHFNHQERLTVSDCRFTITAPRTLSDLLRIKTRAYFGDLELRNFKPELQQNQEIRHGEVLSRIAQDARRWPAIIVYLGVRFLARLRGRYKLYFGGVRWERDESSREWAGKNRHG
jgi:glycosyltransferase involved in cell wall biosynthesis